MDRRRRRCRPSRSRCPTPAALSATLDLPGRLEAYSQAPIFARVSGYLKSWKRRHRRAGQGRAACSPRSRRRISTSSSCRRKPISPARKANAQLREATLNAAQIADRLELRLAAGSRRARRRPRQQARPRSNPARPMSTGCEALADYKRIVAPFDGVVTARDTDVGALINAGGGGGPADVRGLGHQQAARLRQRAAELRARRSGSAPRRRSRCRNIPNRTFAATVEASSQSVDVASGTTRMQLVVDNAAAS